MDALLAKYWCQCGASSMVRDTKRLVYNTQIASSVIEIAPNEGEIAPNRGEITPIRHGFAKKCPESGRYT